MSPIANAFVTHDRPIPDNKQQIVNTDIPMVQESTEVEPQEQKLTLPINRAETSIIEFYQSIMIVSRVNMGSDTKQTSKEIYHLSIAY